LLALGGVLYVFTGTPVNNRPSEPEGGGDDAAAAGHAPARLVVYYFDMGKDCTTCLNLESYTYETLQTHFGEQLESGEIRWERVDVDLPENGHFVSRFGLYTKSVVLARPEGDGATWHDNLSRIWELVYDKEAYMRYIRTQVDEALEAQP